MIYQQLKQWYERDLSHFAPWDESVINEGGECAAGSGPRYHFDLFTDNNRYHIVAKGSYLGCTATSRKPRAGEDWNRGRDLADGIFSEETWRKILADIVSYELVKVHHKISSESVESVGAA
ncbi:MAG TPA: hypothetical protein VJ742_00700 [Nitrososphaera sp.]|nr:hypothetical protein [Nitrososphaera sp.]